MHTPRRTLVTGGAGFIGSHLVDRLLDDGCHVTVIDNYSTGRPQNLRHRAGHPALAVHQLSVEDYEAVRPLFDGVSWVFHMAALADIVPSIQRPLDYYRANVSGTASVVQAAKDAGVERFLYTASSSCYGIPDAYPTSEEAAIRPQYPYALTKWLGEQIVLHWQQVYGLPAASLRLFNVYGPRSRTSGTYGAVFGVFLAQKLAGKPYTVVGDGTQTRDFTYVTDVVDAFVTAARHEKGTGIFNIGSGSTYSVNRLVELLGGDVVHIPERPGEPKCTFANTSRVTRELAWRPRVSFEEGVQAMLAHIDYWREAPVWDPATIAVATREWFEHLGRQGGA